MASSATPLGLPAITPALKSIFPYIQRAEEIKTQNPVVSYWCAYYAAHLGISFKARDVQSREFLTALLTVLERAKNDIDSEALVDEATGAAFVENFALKVFSVADNEDRSGKSTKSTAKKFLAAANFLEVLNTFPKSEFSEANEEKIRYSKWKAVEIAKALREGRIPAPGPAASVEQNFPSPPTPQHIAVQQGSPPLISNLNSSPSHTYLPLDLRDLKRDVHITPSSADASNSHWGGQGEPTPGSQATGKTDINPLFPNPLSSHSLTRSEQSRSSRRHLKERSGKRHTPRSGSGSSTASGSSHGGVPIVYKDEHMQPSSSPRNGVLKKPSPSSSPTSSDGMSEPKKVHFTPSVIGGSVDGTPLPSPTAGYLGPESIYSNMPSTAPPSAYIPTPSPQSITTSSPSIQNIYAPQQPTLHGSPPQATPLASEFAAASSPQLYAPPAPQAPQIYAGPIALTPGVITRVQKHCRFAISALDYEDRDQALKELRAALAVLGG